LSAPPTLSTLFHPVSNHPPCPCRSPPPPPPAAGQPPRPLAGPWPPQQQSTCEYEAEVSR
jgi:hypothetical protein